MKIGIDIGNVIIGGGGEDTQFFTDLYLATPEVEGAWDFIRILSKAGHELHLVSKCGLKTEEKSLKWLDANSFFQWLRLHRTHFVRKHHLKAPMAQALELDIFIDDRQDIIDSMDGIVEYPILFTSWEQTNTELEKIFATQG
jgi:hypothetical protein